MEPFERFTSLMNGLEDIQDIYHNGVFEWGKQLTSDSGQLRSITYVSRV